MKIYEKKIPILSPVQIVTNKGLFKKKSETPGFSREIFYIHHLKRPTLFNEGILFKLCNASGEILSPAFRSYELKRATLRSADKFRISSILSKRKINKQTVYSVKIEEFPQNMVFDIKASEMKFLKKPRK